MSGIGESRSELLGWLNELLRLNYAKIEQCGTGAAYCQIMDSIYRDVPMHRVRFNATAEYEFLTNFKILQSCFTKHRLEKTILVEKLVKCRFQDNLEFLQWLKRFWTQNKDESTYDPESRRKYRAPVAPVTSNSGYPGSHTSSMHGSSNSVPPSVTKRRVSGPLRNSATSSSRTATSLTSRKSSSEQQLLSVQTKLSQTQLNMENLQKEVGQYKEAMLIMERERDFYFGKLRDIEILSQSTKDLCKEGIYSNDPNELVRFLDKIQQVLYATEEGFEVADDDKNLDDREVPLDKRNDNVSGEVIDTKHQPTHNLITDEETF
ncbi:LADA_0B05402g1_1 [Lachancea dasiensis]|uniref:LADA_0B05402g1_1 n=1 Tax=Lachancea dasiensis TaxID=1072105 RepID=A0A1G4ITP0_9SACH|nr:LADA_0B05402g1_1 [Lachancea dasiensis]